MFTFNVDLGQLIIAGLIGIVGYLVKMQISRFDTRLDKHEDAIFQLSGAVQRLVGAIGVEEKYQGIEKRLRDRP